MHGNLSAKTIAATKRAVASDSETISTVASDSDDSEWFAETAWELLGKEAGLHLHHLTGFPEPSCYKYCAKQDPRKPPAFLFRAILRTNQGWPWLCAAMAGSDAEWFAQIERDRADAAKFRQFIADNTKR